jgi:lipopolysaccharide exporter
MGGRGRSTGSEVSPGSFWRNVFRLMTGVGLAQVVNIGAYPLLTRLYGPEDFGLLAVLTSFCMPISVIAAFGYAPSVVLPEERGEAAALLHLNYLLIALTVTASFAVIFAARHSLEAWVNVPGFAGVVWWLLPAPMLVALNRALDFWLSRLGKYGLMASARVVGAGAGAAVKIGWGVVLRSGAGLFNGFLACEIWKLLVMISGAGRPAMPSLSMVEIGRIARRFKNFPRFHLPFLLFQNLMSYLPMLCFSAAFGAAMVGFFSLGMRMILIPVELAVQSVTQVFYARSVTEKTADGALASLVERTTAQLLLAGLAPFALLGMGGPFLFRVVFGADWSEAGRYAQLLAPALYVQFVAGPQMLFNTLGRQKLGLIWQGCSFFAVLGAVIPGMLLGNEILAVALLSCALFVSYWQLGRINFRLSGARRQGVLKELGALIRRVRRRS